MIAIAAGAFTCGLLLGVLVGGAWEFCRPGGTADLHRAAAAARRRTDDRPVLERRHRRRSA